MGTSRESPPRFCNGLGTIYIVSLRGSRAWRSAEWASKYHFAVARLCTNIESKSKGRRCKVGLSSVSAAERTFLQFLPQKELSSSFCCRTDFFAMQQNFLLCNKASCCTVKLSAVYWSCLLCIKAFYRAVKLSAVKLSTMQWSCLLCIEAVCCALKLSAVH